MRGQTPPFDFTCNFSEVLTVPHGKDGSDDGPGARVQRGARGGLCPGAPARGHTSAATLRRRRHVRSAPLLFFPPAPPYRRLGWDGHNARNAVRRARMGGGRGEGKSGGARQRWCTVQSASATGRVRRPARLLVTGVCMRAQGLGARSGSGPADAADAGRAGAAAESAALDERLFGGRSRDKAQSRENPKMGTLL